MPPFLEAKDFGEEVRGLDPRWNSSWWLPHYLEAFDEAGYLRPIFRVFMPPEYAKYHAHSLMDPKELGLTDDKIDLFGAADRILFNFHATADRFEPKAPWPDPPDVLESYVRGTTDGEDVNWSQWKVEIDKDATGRSVMAPHVLAFYGDWQRLRLWVLLEAYTYIGLLDPRRTEPSQIGEPSWDNDLSGKVISWTVGDVRMLGIVDKVEQEGWLADLYQARRILHWGGVLYERPGSLHWDEGKALDEQARWNAAIAKVRAALGPANHRWKDRLAEFGVRVRRLIELWEHATAQHATPLASAVQDDLRAAAGWAEFLFGLTFDELDARVGREFHNDRTLAHVLRPRWREGRDVAERRLPDFLAASNGAMNPVQLGADDVPAFLNFLDQQQLAVWHLEFAAIIEHTPSDTALDHRFVHLRSLALLVQPVLAALADTFGTAEDKIKVGGYGTKGPMSAFLATRSDWRKQLWDYVARLWCSTQTSGGTRLEDRLDLIGSLSFGYGYEGALRTLLALAALRNFGGHRFSNDPHLLTKYWPQLRDAVVLTPLFYWKVATSLG